MSTVPRIFIYLQNSRQSQGMSKVDLTCIGTQNMIRWLQKRNTKMVKGENGMPAKKLFYLSILMVFIFIGIVLYYVKSPWYLGVYPLGIITGITGLLQIVLLVLSIRNVFQRGIQWRILLAIGIEIVSILLMGYFFLIWLVITLHIWKIGSTFCIVWCQLWLLLTDVLYYLWNENIAFGKSLPNTLI